MSLTKDSNRKFSTVFSQADWVAEENLVDIEVDRKGKNIFFGRNIKEDDFSNLLYLGKCIERAPGTSYLDFNAWLDTTFPHVIYITGTRGSGKSFDLGVLLEGISELNEKSTVQNDVEPITSFLIDTQSQFWTLMYPPNEKIKENKEQLKDLEKWNMEPNNLSNCKIFIPPNSPAITGNEITFKISCDSVTHEEWCSLVDEGVYSPQGHIIAMAVENLSNGFSIADIISFIKTDPDIQGMAESSRNALIYKLEDLERTGLFSAKGIDIESLIQKGVCNVFMLRELRNNDKSLVAGLIARQLFTVMGQYHAQKKKDAFFDKNEEKRELPSKVWLLIDEAHVIAPTDSSSPARSALTEYVKRGRDAGLSLVLATQQPSAVDDKILSQVNVSISHRLTFENDVEACKRRIPTKAVKNSTFKGTKVKDLGDMLRLLKAGQAFVGDHNTDRVVMLAIRPRITSHGGYNPK